MGCMPSSTLEIPPLKVAVVTVSYGSSEVLEQFLSTLRQHEGSVPVVVVDNKPDLDAVDKISAKFGAHYLPLPSNPGYGAGMNAGVRLLTELLGDFDTYFFCNPDVSFIGPTAQKLAQSMTADVDAGSIGPRLLNDDGTTYPSARNIPSVGTGVGHALFSKVWPTNPWTRAYQDAANYDRRRPAGSLSGAAVMVKATVFEQIGGWDEAYFMHFEDIDLGWRIGNAGLKNIYDPAVAVHHSGAHSTKRYAAMVEQAMTDSAIRFMNKRYAGFWRTPLRWAITTGLRVRGSIKVRNAQS